MSEQGLAAMYGAGEGQNTVHHYAGATSTPKKKGIKMACKKKKGKGSKQLWMDQLLKLE